MPAKVIAAFAGAAVFLAAPAFADQWSNILQPAYASIPASYGTPAASVALDYYGCPASQAQSVFLNNQSCSQFVGIENNLNISEFATQAEVQALNSQVSRLDVTLSQKAWSGAALAAALTPMLPTEGNTNHINVGFASMSGYSALSLNYEHVVHDVDFGVGLASTTKYSLAKVNVGFSW